MENSLEKFKKSALSVIEKSKQVAKIESQTDYEFAVEYMMDIKKQVKTWEDLHEESRAAAENAKKKVLDLINIIKVPGNQAVKEILDPACNKWLRDCRAKREADEAKLAVIAKKNEIEFIPALAPVVAKTEVARTTETWVAEVTDLMALVKAVAEGKADIELLEPNTSEISKRAKALGKRFVVPGIAVDVKTNFGIKRAVNA